MTSKNIYMYKLEHNYIGDKRSSCGFVNAESYTEAITALELTFNIIRLNSLEKLDIILCKNQPVFDLEEKEFLAYEIKDFIEGKI